MTADSFDKVFELIDESRSIILTTHVIPDGDAIGSVLSLSGFLTKYGKKNLIINHSPTPDNLKFLDPENSIIVFRDNAEEHKDKILNADLIIILDTNEIHRTKSLKEFICNSEAKKICIDHHLGMREEEFNAVISDTTAPATCQMLYEMMKYKNADFITKEIADPLYVGIMTDTGSFRYPRTTDKTFYICGDLVKRGADPVRSFEEIYASNSIGKVKLTARFLQSLMFLCNNEAVIGVVKKSDYEAVGVEAEQVEGFSTFLMNIKGIRIGIVLVEYRDNIKISFRSKGDIFVNEIAKEFGGGGHKNASGATVQDKNIEDVKKILVSKTEQFLNK